MIGINGSAAREKTQRRQRDVVGGSLVQSDIVLVLFPSHRSLQLLTASKESDRYPREDRHHDQPHQQSQQVTPDRPDPLGGIDAADGAGGIIAYSEWRCEQSDAHREDDDHRIM